MTALENANKDQAEKMTALEKANKDQAEINKNLKEQLDKQNVTITRMENKLRQNTKKMKEFTTKTFDEKF